MGPLEETPGLGEAPRVEAQARGALDVPDPMLQDLGGPLPLAPGAVCRGGLAASFSEIELKQKLDGSECEIRLAIRGKGKGTATFWTCDLTEGYIRINGSYRT